MPINHHSGLPNRDPIQLEVVVTNHNTTTADAQTYEGRSVFSSWVRAPLSNAQEVQILVRSAIAIKGKVRKPIGAATIKATDALQHLGKTKPTLVTLDLVQHEGAFTVNLYALVNDMKQGVHGLTNQVGNLVTGKDRDDSDAHASRADNGGGDDAGAPTAKAGQGDGGDVEMGGVANGVENGAQSNGVGKKGSKDATRDGVEDTVQAARARHMALGSVGLQVTPKLILEYLVHHMPPPEALIPEMPITSLVRAAHSYGHGGFMGAAMAFMQDEEWRDVFRAVDHSAYHKAFVQWKLQSKEPGPHRAKIMLTLENSPVLCAFGIVKSGCVGFKPRAVSASMYATMSPARRRWDDALAHVRWQLQQDKPMHVGEALAMAIRMQRKQQLVQQTAAALDQNNTPTGATTVDAGSAAVNAAGVGAVGHTATTTSTEVLFKDEDDRVLRLKALEQLEGMMQPNMYGYKPIPLEWDIWISPDDPAAVVDATVDHGSPAALIKQAITTALPCCRGLAEKAGKKQILSMGISPARWLNQFGQAINLARFGDVDVGLPLRGHAGFSYRWNVDVQIGHGGATQEELLWDGLYVVVGAEAPLPVPDVKTKASKNSPTGCSWYEKTSVWPLHPEEGPSSQHLPPDGDRSAYLRIELRGDPAGMVKDKGIGVAYIPLTWMLQHIGWAGGPPQGGATPEKSSEVVLWVELGPRERKVDRKGRMAAAMLGDGELELEQSSEVGDGPPLLRMPGGGDVEQPTGGEQVRVAMTLEVVPHQHALQNIGVTPAAAQTCMAMLASPGGLYLDVKSAYSSAEHCMLFVGALSGMGVNAKAVCSFKITQLPPTYPNVLFFHGLNGLENACDNGTVPRGQWVLFNGASFLLDLSKRAIAGSILTVAQQSSGIDPATGCPYTSRAPKEELPMLVDPSMWRQFVVLSERYGFVGGIYIQEPDASPAFVDALCALVNQQPIYLPLGFAFGNVAGTTAAFPDLIGRGFAAQQLLEELDANKELGAKVQQRIEEGQHRRATPVTVISWAHRLLAGSLYMSRKEQRLFLKLLAEMFPRTRLPEVVRKLGGMERVLEKFHEAYEVHYPLNIYEQSFNIYLTKTMLRLMRNYGVLQALTMQEKQSLAVYITSKAMYGYLITNWLQRKKYRKSLHKFAKEALCCLLESCTAGEVEELVALVESHTGERMEVLLRPKSTYMKRIQWISDIHKDNPQQLAYKFPEYPYASLETINGEAPEDMLHTRDKTAAQRASKRMRKCGFCCCIFVYNFIVGLLTLFLWHFYYICRVIYVAWHT